MDNRKYNYGVVLSLLLAATAWAAPQQTFTVPTTFATPSTLTINTGVPLQGNWVFAGGSTVDVTLATKIGFPAGTGTVTSVAMTTPTGLTVTGSPITTSGTLALSLTAGYVIPTTTEETNWNTAFTDRLKWDGGATGLVAATGRTSLGLVIGTNVEAWDADLDALAALSGTNTIYYRSAANTWSAVTIGSNLTFSAGTLSATGGGGSGTVTSVAVTGANGIGVSGSPITTSGTIALSLGAITPTTINGNTITSGTGTITLGSNTLTVAGNATESGTNTGDQNGSTLSLSVIGVPTYSTVQHLMNFALSPGVSSGGTITSSGTANAVDVAAGTGFIRATDSTVATESFFNWAASTALSVPSNTTRYIGVQYNSGSPIIVAKTTDTWDLDTEFPLGVVVNEGGTRYINNIPWATADNMANVIERFDSIATVSRDNRVGGITLSSSGTRNVAVTAGTLLARMSEVTVPALDTSVTGSFDAYYRNGSGGWTKESASTQWENTKYDDGSGTLATMTALFYSSRWFYRMTDGSVVMIYGQSQNTALAVILGNDAPPSSVPDRVFKEGLLIGRFIFQKSASAPATTQSAFGTSFTASNVTSASDLSNGVTGSGTIVLSTSPTLVTPALGTPASGVATNLTGTASGLTAGNVTTNANLTGPVTSVGNATSIAGGYASRSISVENPTATENIPIAFFTNASTITKVIAVLVGSSTPSVTYNIGYGTNVTSLTNVTTSPSAVTSTTTGTTATLNNTAIPASGWLVFSTSAQSGTVNSITVTVEYSVP